MKPWQLIGETVTTDGTALKLIRHDNEYNITANGKGLMASVMSGSEEAMAEFTCDRLRLVENACVLIGGLGMGFTLRAALDLLRPDARVVVAELLPIVVEWNRGPLGPLAAHPLNDRRAEIKIGNVAAILRSEHSAFDAILLDVDNGPSAFTDSSNAWLYDDQGIAAAHAALKKHGVLAVWSAFPDRKFEKRLRRGGFAVRVERVRGRHKDGGPHHVIFIGEKKQIR